MKKGKMMVTIALWFAVFAALSFFMKPVKSTICVAQEGKLLVTGRSGYELSVIYEKVAIIEYRREIDYGTLIDGVDDGKEKSGQWENDEFGQYLLCVNAKVKPCIVLHTEEQTMIINYESEQSTRALYDALVEQINDILHPQSGSDKTLSTEGRMLAVTTRGLWMWMGSSLLRFKYSMILTLPALRSSKIHMPLKSIPVPYWKTSETVRLVTSTEPTTSSPMTHGKSWLIFIKIR